MTNRAMSLEEQVNAAQSILATPAAAEAAKLEWGQAIGCGAVATAMALRNPTSGAGVYESAAGLAIYAGAGSPLTQGMAMGLRGPVSAAELDAVEAWLCPTGAGARQLEVCAFADPTIFALLAERDYRVTEWQLVWSQANCRLRRWAKRVLPF